MIAAQKNTTMMTTDDQTNLDAAGSLSELLDGNVRFVQNEAVHPHQDATRRSELTGGQHPFALVLGCADSRVAAEILFDRGLGDLFVVRTAGHAVDNAVLGSLEYGAEHLGIPLIVVLGHDSCGAVTATVQAHDSGQMPGGYLRPLVEMLSASVITARRNGQETINQIAAEHAVQVARHLPERSGVLAELLAEGKLAIVAMEYSLDGGVRVLSSTLDTPGDVSTAKVA